MFDNSLKHCNKCGEDKTKDNFYSDKTKASGVSSTCKQCRKESGKKYYEDNKEDVKRKVKKWAEENKEKRRVYEKRWKDKNIDQAREYKRAWRKINREHFRKHSREYNRRRYHENPNVRIGTIMRNLVNRSLSRDREKSTSQNLGYSSDDLIFKIESQFREGMTWENHGEWEIDHKIPIKHFLDKGETRPWIINALSNLQPLWTSENCSKGCKYQPMVGTDGS